jgi:hypothetical protein
MSFSMAMTARATNVVANSIFREASGATVASGLATFADLLGRRCDARDSLYQGWHSGRHELAACAKR